MKKRLGHPLAMRSVDEIVDGIGIEGGIKAIHRFGENALEAATANDGAGIGGRGKALDQN